LIDDGEQLVAPKKMDASFCMIGNQSLERFFRVVFRVVSASFKVVCVVLFGFLSDRKEHRFKQKCRFSLAFWWSERWDFNPRPPIPQTGALTGLRYAPKADGPDKSEQPLPGNRDAAAAA
jgi:hypothetical protein